MLILSWLSTAIANDLWVGTAHPYQTIQAAVTASEPGDRVLIDAGTFVGPVVIDAKSDLQVIGAAADPDPSVGTVVVGGFAAPIVGIAASVDIELSDLVLDGDGTTQGLHVDGSTGVALSGVLITHGSTPANGAGAWVHSGSEASFSAVTFDGNEALATGASGGGLQVESGCEATISDCVFTGNWADRDGGGINSEGTLTVTTSHFSDNTGYDSGAGIRCSDSVCTVIDSIFEGGLGNRGVGVHLDGSEGSVVRTAFCDNTTIGPQGRGGALALDGGQVTVRNSVFLDNHADLGGAVHQTSNTLGDLTHNTFVGNIAHTDGAAALFDGDGNMAVTSNLISGSVSSGPAGAALHVASGTINPSFTLFFDNTAVNLFGVNDDDQVMGDPLLPSPPGSCDALDVTPGPGSPAIDAGHPNSTDPDGSPADIGATGGQDAQRDADGDGVFAGEDCDDDDPSVLPGAVEICDGIDNDCDDLADDADPDVEVASQVDWFVDGDQDGFGSTDAVRACSQPSGTSDNSDDCDDASATVFPDADEVCNAIDDDCDGVTDEDCDGDIDRTVAQPDGSAPTDAAGCSCASRGAATRTWRWAPLRAFARRAPTSR